MRESVKQDVHRLRIFNGYKCLIQAIPMRCQKVLECEVEKTTPYIIYLGTFRRTSFSRRFPSRWERCQKRHGRIKLYVTPWHRVYSIYYNHSWAPRAEFIESTRQEKVPHLWNSWMIDPIIISEIRMIGLFYAYSKKSSKGNPVGSSLVVVHLPYQLYPISWGS